MSELKSICCSRLKVEPLFNDIDEGQYMKPVKLLSKSYKHIKHFAQLAKRTKPNDECMLRYIQCRPNMRCYIHSENTTEVVFSKSINLSETGLRALLFQLYSVRQFDHKLPDIDPTKSYSVYFYDGYYEPPEGLYKAESFIETILVAKLTLHIPNLFYLDHTNLDGLKNPNMRKCLIIFSRLMYAMYTNLSQLEMEEYYISGSFALSIMGLRRAHDIDLQYIGNNISGTEKIQKNINRNEIDFAVNDEWVSYKINKWLGNTDMQHDPKFYIYFLGCKIISLEMWTKYMFHRNRPKSVADLIAVNIILGTNFAIPSIPIIRYPLTLNHKTEKISYLTDQSIKDSVQIGFLTHKQVKEKREKINPIEFLNTIQKNLKHNYNISKSINAIKKIIVVSSKI